MIAFRAHRKETDQTGFTPGTYSQVLFPDTTPDAYYNAPGYNYGGRFSASLWTPVIAGEPEAKVSFDGQIWIPNGNCIAAGDYYVARIVKNGYPSGISIGAKVCAKGAFSNDWPIDLSMQDIAQPGDSYGVYLFTSNGGIVVNGVCLHTWWSGMVLQ